MGKLIGTILIILFIALGWQIYKEYGSEFTLPWEEEKFELLPTEERLGKVEDKLNQFCFVTMKNVNYENGQPIRFITFCETLQP